MKKWEKPRLIVLVRVKPQEAILTVCKTGESTQTSGPNWEWYGCVYNWDYAGPGGCFIDNCSTPGNS
jgi:hypothetical protein